ncbi:MAG: rhomboid family intramembrane serine protease [Bacteroidia bacterium]
MTLYIVIITCILSIVAFSRTDIMERLILHPYSVQHKNEWYRMVTSGFLHADWLHLLINMFVLFSFGGVVNTYYGYVFVSSGNIHFVIMYITSIFAANVHSLYKYKDAYQYKSLGASGAVSAVVFASILFQPLAKIYLYGIIGIPGIVAGILYLVYSNYAAKKQNDNINHDAHFYGAVYGIAYTIVFKPAVIKIFMNRLAEGF